jgi:hypothetical protein
MGIKQGLGVCVVLLHEKISRKCSLHTFSHIMDEISLFCVLISFLLVSDAAQPASYAASCNSQNVLT